MHDPGARYEHQDASAVMIVLSFLGLWLLGFASAEALKVGFHKLDRRFHAESAPPGFEPPSPRLEVDEPADLRAYRAREARLLTSYGKTAGTAHIPIERAMELLGHE